MKSLLVLCIVFVAVSGLPAKKTDYDDSEESFFLFPKDRPHNKEVPSVVEVEVGDSDEDAGFFPSYFRPLFFNPFSFMNFGFSDFFSKPSWFESLYPKDIPQDAVKHSTVSTKVVDGHKITVNETTFESQDKGAVYRFQVIDISPVDSKEKGDSPSQGTEKGDSPVDNTENGDSSLDTRDKADVPSTGESTTQLPAEKESSTTEGLKPDQNSEDNEIHREEMFANYELQGDDPSVYENNVETIEINQPEKRHNPVDLSSDTRVNRLLAENARRGGLFMVPPEVEVFDTLDYDALSQRYQQQQSMDAQEIIRPEFNQEIVRPEFNQEVIRPEFNQEVVRPQFNQKFNPHKLK